ncbi:unannotated protein [freshwater metagenome]|uniref:Unannotated protein n=1 Tax=freshwater metagenome TaxID=449393 RepID=A0A6J7VR53_9ZZZZ
MRGGALVGRDLGERGVAADAKEYGFVDHVVKSAVQVSGSGGTSR